ncbi:RNA-binding protein [Candidatus Woesearchaeota archaeon CG10_big_fil_rev_8_21_14_0_10_44_13]|nr:MAG: RNA-binding protein [Candidatus Woesearchaeota archaeon CG10_big_fil_rev_8_21_14_0_10_44_13]
MNDDLKKHLNDSLMKGVRYDGRKLDEYRKIVVETGISKSAEGSARVLIGETEVLVGIKLSVDKPYPDTPNEGCLMVDAQLLPLSSPEFETGPPDIQAIELARVVDRGVREAKTIDMKKLCIKKGEKVWMVSIDVCTVNDAGNLLDASALGAVAALKDARFPEYDDVSVDYKKHTDKKLPLTKIPVAVTIYKIGDMFLVDPLPEEERIFDAKLTVTTTKDGKICAMQKGGDLPLKIEDIKKMVEIGVEKAKELLKSI